MVITIENRPIQIKCRVCGYWSLSYGIRKTTNKHVNLNKTNIKPNVSAQP